MLGLVLLFAAMLLSKYFPAQDGAGMISTAAVLDVTEEEQVEGETKEPAEVEMDEEEAEEGADESESNEETVE